MKKIFIIIIIALILTGIVINFTKYSSGLPSYATKNKNVKEAYLFAKENPAALEGINCHCGCMTVLHGDETKLHKDLKDCYIEGNGFNEHASGCSVCINEALQVKSLIANNTKESIKEIIDKTY